MVFTNGIQSYTEQHQGIEANGNVTGHPSINNRAKDLSGGFSRHEILGLYVRDGSSARDLGRGSRVLKTVQAEQSTTYGRAQSKKNRARGVRAAILLEEPSN